MSDDVVIYRARRAVAPIAFNPPRYATDLLLDIADMLALLDRHRAAVVVP